MKPPFPSLGRLFHWCGAAVLAAVGFNLSARAQSPLLEARFNDATDMDLHYGATLDAGVSGLADDKSYSADVSKIADGEKGPMATTGSNNPVTGMNEFTITAWYKPRQAPRNDATLFSLLGTVLIWEEKTNQWVLRIDTKPAGDPKPSGYWFYSGDKPPLGSWTNPGEWNFIAMTWRRSGRNVVFYQGSSSVHPAVAKDVSRGEDVAPLDERPNAKRVIGNSGGPVDRPFDGNIDDFRFYPAALSDAAIEKIYLADLKNKAPVLP